MLGSGNEDLDIEMEAEASMLKPELEEGGILFSRHYRFWHPETLATLPRGGITITGVLVKLPNYLYPGFAGEEVYYNAVAVGISVCSPQDNFSKKRGRQISLGRARRVMNEKFTFDEESELEIAGLGLLFKEEDILDPEEDMVDIISELLIDSWTERTHCMHECRFKDIPGFEEYAGVYDAMDNYFG